MLELWLTLVTFLVTVLSLSGIFLCRSEIAQEWRQASLKFKASSHHFEREATAGRKLRKTRQAYVRERLKEQEHLNSEISSLDRLLKENSIDKYTYARYKKLLKMGYEQKRQQTRERYGLIKNLTTAP
jgi:hypothetical protein